MLALALVLLALVILLVVASFVGSSEEVVIEFLNVTVTTSVGGVFVAGFVAGLIALASMFSLRVSSRRLRKRRKEVRELRQQAERSGMQPAAPGTTDTRTAEPEQPAIDSPEATPGPASRDEPDRDDQADPAPTTDDTGIAEDRPAESGSGASAADEDWPSRSDSSQS
jgi:uncharacterized membrane protein YciS (DUF1049 family)